MTKSLAPLPSVTKPVIVILILLQFTCLQGVASFILKASKSQELISLSPQLKPSSLELQQKDKLPQERFLILTTGEQIKLYKFSDSDANTIRNEYYLVRPLEFEGEQINRLPNNSFSRWLQSRRLATKEKRRKSVIPESQYEHEDQNFGSSGWLKPWITHVDYFLDTNFCNSRPEVVLDCLVIVWLDKANNYVRYGSTPFPPATLQAGSPPTTTRNKNNNILWLREFPPIEILSHISANTSVPYVRPRAHAMVLNKMTHRVHVALGDGSGKLANHILSGILRPDGAKNSANTQQLGEQSLVRLLRDQREENLQIDDGHELADLSYLNVDEADGDWLFFHENRHVFMVNVKPSPTHSSNHLRAHVSRVYPVLPLKPFSNQTSKEKHSDGPPNSFNAIMGFAMDKLNRRLFWLDEMNTLFSSQYSGSSLQEVAKLSMKPVIKSADTIQVHHDAIYISDSIKKSILVYRLPEAAAAASDTAASGEQLTNSISTLQATGSNNSSRLTGEAKMSLPQYSQQQVIAIEMPTIYGFRVFEVEKQDSRISSLEAAMATRGNRFMPLQMANSITSMPRSLDIDDLLGETAADSTATYTIALEPDARFHEPEIDLTAPILAEKVLIEGHEEQGNKLAANLMRLNTFVELLLVSIFMITCFVVLNLLIRLHRQQHHREIRVNLVKKNCPI